MRRAILSCFVLSIALGALPLAAGINFWTPIGPDGGEILALAADPQRSAVVYVGSWGGVFKSTDGGATWTRTSRGLKGNGVFALAVAPSNGSVVYAGTSRGVFASRDGGATWSGSPSLGFLGVLSVAVDPRDARRVWAGTQNGLYSSRDFGATWKYADSDLIARVADVTFDPTRPDTIYAAIAGLEDFGATGVVKSTDGGVTWKLKNKGLEEVSFATDRARIAVDPTSPNVVYASFGTLGTLSSRTYRSLDGGATWRPTPGDFPVAVDRKGVVYAGILHSFNRGETWQGGASLPDGAIRYAVSAAADGTVWAATHHQGVVRSRDRAVSWQASSKGLAATTVASLAIDPQTPRVIYAGAGTTGVLKTLSTGQSWRPLDSSLPVDLRGFLSNEVVGLDPQHPQTLYLGWDSAAYGFARSDDGGAHWTLLRTEFDGGALSPTAVVVDPASPDTVYLTGSGVGANTSEVCGLARSDDRGATRRCLLPPGTEVLSAYQLRLVPDPAKPGTLWLLENRDRLWKSTNRGDTWTQIAPRGLQRAGEPRSLLLDAAHPGVLYLGTESTRHDDRVERVWRSDDDGLSWRAWGKGMPASSKVTDLVIDPQQPAFVHASVQHFFDPSHPEDDRSGVYQSRDGGRTFTTLRDGLPGLVLRLVQDPKNPRKLYAGTLHNGIYELTRP